MSAARTGGTYAPPEHIGGRLAADEDAGGWVGVMSDLSLLLEAPDREWAKHVESLIQRVLGGRGSLALVVVGEGLADPPEASICFLTGVVVCDEPTDRMLAMITSALLDFDVERRRLDSGVAQIVVRPLQP
jgi:hypothetical protein